MRFRFKSILGIITILIITCIAIGIGYLFYHDIKEADIVVDDYLTINYVNGQSFTLNGDNTIEFSVTNNSSESSYYYIKLTDVLASDVKFELSSSDNVNISNDLKDGTILNQVIIDGNKTCTYTLKFITSNKDEYKGMLKIGIKSNEENTFADVILNSNKISDATLSNIGESALLDEGMLSMPDDLGIAYYFRGNVTNNNVYFANKNWKVVKINGDGSVKLVLDGILSEVSKYYETDVDYESSKVKEVLEDWFTTNLDNYSDYIAFHKFCNDIVFEPDKTTFTAYNRIVVNKIPTFACLGTPVNERIGLITADEVMLAGGSLDNNTSYYLYNSEIKNPYFTMTSAITGYSPFAVDTNGAITTDVSGSLLRGVRPVINIVKTAHVTGTGTKDDPYQIITE